MQYRYWCGECGFSTGWTGETEGRLQLLRHCRRWHRGIPVGGHRERARGRADRWGGCLVALCVGLALVVPAVVLLVLLV